MNKTAKIGDTISKMALSKKYNKWAAKVLNGEYIEIAASAGGKGKPATYKIMKELPTSEAYAALCNTKFTTTVDALVEDAKSICEDLAGQMHDWFDSMPEQFQNSEKGDQINDAADQLEIDWPDLEEITEKIKTVHLPMIDANSRAKQASEAGSMLRDAAAAIEEYVDSEQEHNEEFDSGYLDDLAQMLESISDEIEGIDWPQMFG